MGITLPGGLAEAMSMMGVQFPSTDEDTLQNAAAQWRSVASRCSGWHGDLSQAVDYIGSTNENNAAETFTGYAHGQSNVSGVQALGTNANAIADGFEKAAQAVRAYKTTCIATATTVAALIKAIRTAPGTDVEAFKAQIERAGNLLKQADAKTASVIGGK